ncbi:MAG: hypothetical protein Fur0010_21950 [Bdellovibrio sp.]
MKNLLIIFLFLISEINAANICSPDPTPRFSKFIKVHSGARTINIKWSGNEKGVIKTYKKPGPFGSYLSLDLPFESFKSVYDQLKVDYVNLKSRGEAHITLVTPVEFHCLFKPAGTSIDQIEKSIHEYLKSHPNMLKFELDSIGSHQLDELETFFIIVKSDDFMKLRKQLELLPNQGFVANKFYPHITLGFTDRDLHSSDGVIKDNEHSRDGRYNLVIESL